MHDISLSFLRLNIHIYILSTFERNLCDPFYSFICIAHIKTKQLNVRSKSVNIHLI